MPKLTHTFSPVLFALAATGAFAGENDAQMQAFLEASVLPWAQDAAILDAVAAQNAKTGGYDQATIDQLDTTWRGEVGDPGSALISSVIGNAASDFLRQQVAATGGQITEIIVMDAKGLNVAASGVTSDYWQGDEAKHSDTFGVGAGAVHYGEIEFDESSQTYQAQISFTLVDPATGAPIGAMTVAVDGAALL